ncbi:DNA starvation/stationary phase protection protein [bacterium]|nr:DNA starvation/stationary phase protection protein [bacterium]
MSVLPLSKPSNNNVSSTLKDKDAKALAEKLTPLLANNYALYLKTQGYHWNVTGPHFYGLHKMFEEQYISLAEANDALAERIRSIGYFAPASFSALSQLSSIAEDNSVPEDSNVMLKNLATAHGVVIKQLKDIIELASEHGDEATADLATERLDWHEKTLWMLNSSLA